MVQPRQRILFAIPSLDRGGPDRVIFDLLRGLDRARFEPHLAISASEGFYLDRLPGDVMVRIISDDQGLQGRYPVFPLVRAVEDVRPHAVLATLRMVMTAGFAKPFFPRGVKLVSRIANQISTNMAELKSAAPVKHRVSHFVMKRALYAADHIVCQSKDMEADLRKGLGPRVKSSVIGNPIDLDFVRGLKDAEKADLPGAPALLTVGRLMHQKGMDVLLDAFATFRGNHPQAHLTIVGDGPDRTALEAQAERLGVAEAVRFAGFVTNPYPLMARADLFLLASRYEGFPNVVIEALACGTPVVASDCPGATRDILFAEEGGFLAPFEDAAGFSATMEAAIGAGPFDAELLSAACARRHDLKSIARAYENVLAGVSHTQAKI